MILVLSVVEKVDLKNTNVQHVVVEEELLFSKILYLEFFKLKLHAVIAVGLEQYMRKSVLTVVAKVLLSKQKKLKLMFQQESILEIN